MIIRKVIPMVIAILLVISSSIKAEVRNDSITLSKTEKQNIFKAKQLIAPGILIAVGASGLFFSSMKDLDKSINNNMEELRSNHKRIKIDNWLRFTPSIANFALHFSGVNSPYDTRDRILLTTTSFASVYILTQGIKHITHRTRPDRSDSHSFPSGHVATAFLGAEQMRMNYGNLWGTAGYAIATGTAFLRLYNNRHWFSDVIGGAGIGILSARIGYWLLPLEKRLFKINSSNTKLIAIPTFNSFDKSYGINMAVVF